MANMRPHGRIVLTFLRYGIITCLLLASVFMIISMKSPDWMNEEVVINSYKIFEIITDSDLSKELKEKVSKKSFLAKKPNPSFFNFTILVSFQRFFLSFFINSLAIQIIQSSFKVKFTSPVCSFSYFFAGPYRFHSSLHLWFKSRHNREGVVFVLLCCERVIT